MTTQPPSRRYRSVQVLFGIVFLLSIGLLLVSLTSLNGKSNSASPPPTAIAGGTATPPSTGTPAPAPAPSTATDESLTTVILPLLTASLSLLGFVSTTFLAWRKERRDARVGDLELERAKLELEKARMEIEKLKAAGPRP